MDYRSVSHHLILCCATRGPSNRFTISIACIPKFSKSFFQVPSPEKPNSLTDSSLKANSIPRTDHNAGKTFLIVANILESTRDKMASIDKKIDVFYEDFDSKLESQLEEFRESVE